MRSELLALAALLAAVVVSYLYGHLSGSAKYRELAAAVEMQKADATALLEELTAERDDLQAALDLFAKHQETKDAHALAEIERLDSELRNRPVRVRIVTESGACSDSSASDGAGPAGAGAGSTAAGYGLLPAENSERLGAALTEVETLSAAYNSCRARLVRRTQQ